MNEEIYRKQHHKGAELLILALRTYQRAGLDVAMGIESRRACMEYTMRLLSDCLEIIVDLRHVVIKNEVEPIKYDEVDDDKN